MSALLLAGCGGAETGQTKVDGGILGEVTVFSPGDHPTGLVFLLSDAGGWSGRMTTAAKHLRKRGLIAVGVDTAAVLANLARAKEDCHELTDAFETTSHTIQKQAALRFYFLPTLAGIREGAVLALAGLWQAGPETIGAVATVNFEPTLSGAVPLCADPPAADTPDSKGFLYSPPKQLFGWWQAAWTEPPSPAAREFASTAGAVSPPEETGAGSKTPPRLLTAMLDWGSEEHSSNAEGALQAGRHARRRDAGQARRNEHRDHLFRRRRLARSRPERRRDPGERRHPRDRHRLPALLLEREVAGDGRVRSGQS